MMGLVRRGAASVPTVLFCATCLADTPAAAPMAQSRKGGTLRVAMIGESPSLDMHATTAPITREVGINIFETLFTVDEKCRAIPHLAEDCEALDGGRRCVIRLRRGVRFHNGKELMSADVVASLRRWGRVASPGNGVFRAVEAKGPTTVELRLKEASSILPTVLAQVGSAAAIYPKEVIDAARDGPLKAYIGTGPFRF